MDIADLQNNWTFILAYRNAPQYEDGSLFKGERQKLLANYGKTGKQYTRLVNLVKKADKNGGELDLQDRRYHNLGAHSQLTSPQILTFSISCFYCLVSKPSLMSIQIVPLCQI